MLKSMNSFKNGAWSRQRSRGLQGLEDSMRGEALKPEQLVWHDHHRNRLLRGSWVNVWANIFMQKNDLKHPGDVKQKWHYFRSLQIFFSRPWTEHTRWEIIVIVHHCIYFNILNPACKSVLEKIAVVDITFHHHHIPFTFYLVNRYLA